MILTCFDMNSYRFKLVFISGTCNCHTCTFNMRNIYKYNKHITSQHASQEPLLLRSTTEIDSCTTAVVTFTVVKRTSV